MAEYKPRFDYEEGICSLQLMLNHRDDERNGPTSNYKIVSEGGPQKNIDGVKCPTCNSDNIYVETKQLRSGDEGATNIYECLVCHTRWQRNN